MLKHPKRLAGMAGLAASLLLSAACGAGAGAPADIDLGSGPAKSGTIKKDALSGLNMTFVSYGGAYQEGQQKAAVDPFAQESGAKILQDGPTDYAKIKAQVDSSNVTWDVIDTDSIWAEAQCGKLLQPLDYSIIDKSKVPEGLATQCSVPAMQYGMVLVYNKNKFGANPPTGWKDFFDTAKFPGKRGISGTPGDSAPGPFEAALIADGVAPDKLYPLDVDRATKKLQSIRPNLVFWKTGAESQQLLESGEVDMAMMWSGRAYAAVKNGAPYDVTFDQWMPIMDSLTVPKNAKNPKASMALINYYLGAQQQAKLTELTSYSPINTDAKPNLDAKAQTFLTTRPEAAQKALKIDSKWWAEHQSEMIEKWSAWLGG
ncbi:ABC transporter substrate-binding protein [Nonomuraea sp. NPDC000554]|uniref:ABC transporter substrate-binding protein n=1 Tax=Nonomuraea sp. NPDC000554 TaxID=3154259 RepID=UPI0033213845